MAPDRSCNLEAEKWGSRVTVSSKKKENKRTWEPGPGRAVEYQ